MPKGVPKNGFRMTRGRMDLINSNPELASQFSIINQIKQQEKTSLVKSSIPSLSPQDLIQNLPSVSNETDEEIYARLNEKFHILGHIVDACIAKDVRSLIISGPAGVGKSHMVETKLAAYDPNKLNHAMIKGYVRTTGLFRMLWQYREVGQILVFDDADTILFDQTSLNILKAVCDSGKNRVVSYLSEFEMLDDGGEKIPKQFEFNGTIIFISNLDFDGLANRGHRLAPHLQALCSRSLYVDLKMHTKRDCFVRIKQVIQENNMLDDLDSSMTNDVLSFIETNITTLRELSLRTALKVAQIRKNNNGRWSEIAKLTCCK